MRERSLSDAPTAAIAGGRGGGMRGIDRSNRYRASTVARAAWFLALCAMSAAAHAATVAPTGDDFIFGDSFDAVVPECVPETATPDAIRQDWVAAVSGPQHPVCIPGGTFEQAPITQGTYCAGATTDCVGSPTCAFVIGIDDSTTSWDTQMQIDADWHGSVTIPVAFLFFGVPQACTLVVSYTGGSMAKRFTYTASPPATASGIAFASGTPLDATLATQGCDAFVSAGAAQIAAISEQALAQLWIETDADSAAINGSSACPAPLPAALDAPPISWRRTSKSID
jgi:hypothetical protein